MKRLLCISFFLLPLAAGLAQDSARPVGPPAGSFNPPASARPPGSSPAPEPPESKAGFTAPPQPKSAAELPGASAGAPGIDHVAAPAPWRAEAVLAFGCDI